MIRKIKWKNHNILGDLELDFTKEDGSIYNTIILAGENGTGKTTILETLANLFEHNSIESFDSISYDIENSPYEITNDIEGSPAGVYNRINKITNEKVRVNPLFSKFKSDNFENLRNLGFVYSRARSGFNTKKVTSSTTNQLDSNKHESDNSDDFTFIKQLLVDIDTQDNSKWMEITKSKSNTSFEEFKENSKLYRFEKAFNSFFENMQFYGVDNTKKQEKDIIFKKYNEDISVDNMSTGEKQIVFRSALLLKNLNSLYGGIVLIDEPELSMHPKWQKKILNYYRNLFAKDGIQDVQIIIATHSEYILQSALEDKDNSVIITLKDNEGILETKKITAPSVLPTITLAETNYIAFGIASTDYHNQLYGFLQNKTGSDTVTKCDGYILSKIDSEDSNLKKHSEYKHSSGKIIYYETLPTYIRNAIDHPGPDKKYSEEELEKSIDLLIKLCKES